jgi:hypothetical protein
MAVDTFDPQQFDPSSSKSSLDTALVDRAVSCALAQPSAGTELSLASEEVFALAPLVVHAGWLDAGQELTSDSLVALIRLFTLGEGQFSTWQAGAKSAVVKLVRVLKQRGEMTPELTRWIKANTDNRFLPHGDLMDRL